MSQQHITNNDIISAWGNAPQVAAQQHGDEGDFARQHLLNPALFSLMGDLRIALFFLFHPEFKPVPVRKEIKR